MKAIDFQLTYTNGQLKRNGRSVSEDKIISEVMKKCKTLSYSQVEELIESWKVEPAISELTNINEYIRTEVINSGILNNFIVVKNQGSSILHYRRPDNSIILVGALPLAPNFIAHAFQIFEPDKFQELRILIAPMLKPKLHVTMDDAGLATVILNASYFYTDASKQEEMNEGIRPLTLNGKELAYHSLNYKPKANPKLNPTLEEFLSRVRNHEQLCAILWLMFNGIKTPYLVYLYGSGGEGKSSFIKMLCQLVKIYGSFQKEGRHRFFHMFGKAIITLTENTESHLLQNKDIKEITGGSNVPCEEKNKTAFSSVISGLLLADSNVKPRLIGEEYEYRRLRYFEIIPSQNVERLSTEKYVSLLGSSPDDFISYCEQCYNKVGKNDLVENNDDMTAVTATLIDSATTYKYELSISQMKLYFNPTKQLTTKEFYDKFYKLKNNQDNKFYLDNFKTYLRIYHKVIEENGILKGATFDKGETF